MTGFDGRERARNAWWPETLVSLLFPMLGLLLIRDGKNRRGVAWTVFAIVVVAHLALRVVYLALGSSTDPSWSGETWIGTTARALEYLATLVSAAFGAVYTHDEVVRVDSRRGQSILFGPSVERPMQENDVPRDG